MFETLRPHPIEGYEAASKQADIMLDPRQPLLNKIGGGAGMVGNAIMTVTDLIPGVGAIEKKLE